LRHCGKVVFILARQAPAQVEQLGVWGMTRFMTARRRSPSASVQVVELQVRERLDIDLARTSELFSSFGEQGAQGLISDTLGDLEQSVRRLRSAVDHAQIDGIADIAAEIGVVAASMGFWSCARVAGDLKECAQPGNAHCIPAIVERLSRMLAAAQVMDWRNPVQQG
jgi:hypothetical protein